MMNERETSTLFSPTVWIPENVEEAWRIKEEFGDAAIFIAGGTFLQTKWQKGTAACPSHLISLERIKELQGIVITLDGEQTVLCIGAHAMLNDCKDHPEVLKNAPMLSGAVRRIAAPAVRNRGTLGGNIAYGFGDTIPALLALGAFVVLFDGKGRKTVPLTEYNEEKNGVLISICIPEEITTSKSIHFFRKIGHREAFSPSVITVSGNCLLDSQNHILDIRLAVGGADTLPRRLTQVEQLIKCFPENNLEWEKVHQAITISEEFITCSDSFYSADYKRMAAANLIISELSWGIG